MKQIIDFLHNLGLSEAEIKIYVKLLELGRVSITELAHSLGMNRVTAHFNIQSLIDQGLITQVKQGRSRELTAQPPEALKYLIEQKDKQLKSLHEQFDSALPALSNLMPAGTEGRNKFDVKFYQGTSGARAIYREVLKTKELRSYVNVNSVFTLFPENQRLFIDAMRRQNMVMREIVDDSQKTKEDIKKCDPARYFYKFFPSDWQHSDIYDYMMFDGKTAMIAGTKEPNGIIITNAEMYRSGVALFELLWRLLPEPK